MSMITATAWVPRGFAARHPTKYDIDETELARISKLAKLQLDDAKVELEAETGAEGKVGIANGENDGLSGLKVPQSNGEVDDDLREYDLEHYDDEDEVGENGESTATFGNVQSLAYHQSNEEDPYITIPDEEDEEEKEELEVLPADNMVVAAKVEDEVAHLEIYVYEDEADNLYVHHDIMLPAIPLCVEWLDVPVGSSPDGLPFDQTRQANFVAVGTFDPNIEIWDLDTVDRMYPNAILGHGGQQDNTQDPGDSSTKKKKKRKRSKKANDDYHVDAILALAANRNHRTLLASGSADKTIKLWDLSTTKCAKSYSYHTDKVCSLAWHPKETTVLLSGSYDRTIVAADMRTPHAKPPRWAVESDVEMVRWNPHDPNYFYVTTESGIIHYFDVRNAPSKPEASSPVWKLQAHDESVSCFDINPHVPGFLATGSTSQEVKLWNVQAASGPSMVVSRNLDVGKVFSTTFAPDPQVGFRLAVAGSKGIVRVWDTSTNAAIRRAFADRVAPVKGDVVEKLVGVEDDSEESDSDEDVDEGGIETGGADDGFEDEDGDEEMAD
ncbi:hypothetical protein MMC25_000198 [Agyrium rufum]|nr:hypothetical protein [Agyrium rufum]